MPAATVPYEEIAPQAEAALRKAIPDAAVFTERGHLGRVRVKLIAPSLNGKTEQEKQELTWSALRAELGGAMRGVSVVIAYGTDEL